MRKVFAGALTLLTSLPLIAWQGDVTIETPNTQMLLTVREGGDLQQSYYGDKSATLQQLRDAGADLSFHALPAFGTVDPVHTPALQVQHADGDLNLELRVTNYEMKLPPSSIRSRCRTSCCRSP